MKNLAILHRSLPETEMWEYNQHLAFFETYDDNLDFAKILLLAKLSKCENILTYLQTYKINNKSINYLLLAIRANVAGNAAESVKLLINFIESFKINTTPLHVACEYGLLNVVTYLIAEVQNLDIPDYLGWSPIHWAAWLNKVPILQLLISNGANIETKGNHNETPFYLAAFNGHLEASKILLDKNASMNIRNSLSHAPLHLVSYNEHMHIISLMLSYGADIDIRSDIRYNTPLHVAAWHGKAKSATYLLDNGCDINARIINGGTALHRAALNGNTELVILLLDRGADIDAVDYLDRTPLICALKNQHLEVYNLLLSRGS